MFLFLYREETQELSSLWGEVGFTRLSAHCKENIQKTSNRSHSHSHPRSVKLAISPVPQMHVFGLREEAKLPGGDPHGQQENIKGPHPLWDSNWMFVLPHHEPHFKSLVHDHSTSTLFTSTGDFYGSLSFQENMQYVVVPLFDFYFFSSRSHR